MARTRARCRYGNAAARRFCIRKAVLPGTLGTHWSVSAGRQYSPINTLIAASDAFGQTYWGNSQGTGIGQQSPNATPATGGFQAAARINNSLLYSSTYGAWTARVMGSSGDEIKSAGRSIGASLAYQSGPAFASVAVHRGRQFAADIPAGATPDWQQSWAVGGAYDFSLVKLFGGYYRFTPSTDNLKVTAATTLRSESGWLGARIPVSPNNTVITQLMLSRYRHMDGVENGKALTMGLAFEHALSKRTALYAAWGRLNNNATSSNWLWGSTVVATPARAGADVSALSVGMWHRF
nr:porin [Diaphorobacter aerolatus]